MTFTEEKIIKELFVSKAWEEDVEYPKCCFGKGKKILWFEMCGHVKILFDILSVVCCQLPLSESRKASTFES